MLECHRSGRPWLGPLAAAQPMPRPALRALPPDGPLSRPFRGHLVAYDGEWPRITVAEAFRRYAGRDIRQVLREGVRAAAAARTAEGARGGEVPGGEGEGGDREAVHTGGAARVPGAPNLLDRISAGMQWPGRRTSWQTRMRRPMGTLYLRAGNRKRLL